MIVRPWLTGDTERLDLQSAQQYMHSMVDVKADLSGLSQKGFAWTGECDGQVMAIAGLMPIWENRALAWALIGGLAGAHFAAIHRAIRKGITDSGFRRIEATVDVGFAQGHRWMTMLGFEMEGYMKAYRPDGADMLLYARVVT
jgi:hypothetical protein